MHCLKEKIGVSSIFEVNHPVYYVCIQMFIKTYNIYIYDDSIRDCHDDWRARLTKYHTYYNNI